MDRTFLQHGGRLSDKQGIGDFQDVVHSGNDNVDMHEMIPIERRVVTGSAQVEGFRLNP